MPDSIDDRPPGKHVGRTGQPPGQGGAAASFAGGGIERELRRHAGAGQASERSRSSDLARLLDVAAPQQADRPRGAGDHAVDVRGPNRQHTTGRPRRARAKGPVAPIETGEDGLQAVIVFLRDRVELVVVAACAVDRQADEGGHGIGKHVVAVDELGLELIDGPLAELGVAHEVPRAGGDEPRGDHAPRIAGLKHVAGNLLADELAVGQVAIETLDHVIAIGPGVVAPLVLVVAVGIAIVHDVQPVSAPPLAVMGRTEQALDQALVSAGMLVAHERLDLLGGGRQADAGRS